MNRSIITLFLCPNIPKLLYVYRCRVYPNSQDLRLHEGPRVLASNSEESLSFSFMRHSAWDGHHVYRVLSLTSEISFVCRPSRNLTAGITNGVVVGQKVTKFGIRTLQLGACPDNSGPHEKFNPGCSCTGPNLVETNLNEVEGIPTCIPSRRPSPTLSEFQVSTAVRHRPLGCKIYPRGPIRNF